MKSPEHSTEIQDSVFPATFTMHTPGRPTNACVRHARAVEQLFYLMGCHVHASKAPEGAQCDNCVNENRAAITKALGST